MIGKEKTFKHIPKRIQIETIYGCNAKCRMCPIHLPSSRPKGIMSMEMFKDIIDQMEPYKDSIKLVDMWGVGEPLLDKNICERIRYAKSKGLKNIAIATNAELLNDKLQDNLLKSGIDTIIFGIDGIDKETHEYLRGVDFDKVMNNTLSIIRKRDIGNYKTRFIIRFVKQKDNEHQWEEYQKFWKSKISEDKGDMIISYSIRSWDEEVPIYQQPEYDEHIDKMPCHHVFDRLIVLIDGTVPMCCGDFHNANYPVGNMKDTPLMDIFNSDDFNMYRRIHSDGNKNMLPICRDCSILYSESTQYRWNDDNRWDWRKCLK